MEDCQKLIVGVSFSRSLWSGRKMRFARTVEDVYCYISQQEFPVKYFSLLRCFLVIALHDVSPYEVHNPSIGSWKISHDYRCSVIVYSRQLYLAVILRTALQLTGLSANISHDISCIRVDVDSEHQQSRIAYKTGEDPP